MKKDCWWNESNNSGKDAASLETPITPAAETSITGILIQSDDNEFVCQLILRSGCAGYKARAQSHRLPDRSWSCDISVPTKPARQLGKQTQRTWSGTQIGHWTSVHYDGQHDHMPAHTRDGIHVAGDVQTDPKKSGRQAAWQWASKLYRIRGTYLENEATFFKPKMEWRVASTSTFIPDEREFIVDSGASVHMVNKTDLSPEELETREPKSTLNIWTCSFVTVQLLEDTPAVLYLWENLAKKMVFI